ncbi:putative uncharacterized protein [Parachlamydia acanthamoebae UV-7]|uniref:Uncharacterized protein n=1 Tax=Parachlamydia acanthamoebae (strain UV7) TaxID=765952 RepID=F8L2D7_PARAV|nr:hypothetical protein [Parachlamydia acanthamoebae]CCB87450.1 putative uncharacterized protein [Parachlamydia acanthamoebae UV-7]
MEPVDSGRMPKIPHAPLESEGIRVEKVPSTTSDIRVKSVKESAKYQKLSGDFSEDIEDTTLRESLTELSEFGSELSGSLETAELISEAETPSVQEWAERNAPYWVDLILAKDEAAEKFNQFFTSTLNPFSTPTEYMSVFVGVPLGHVAKIRDYNGIGKELSTDIGYLRLAYSLPAHIGAAGILIYRIAIYREIAKQVAKMKVEYKANPDPALKAKIREVKKWLTLRKSVLKAQSIGTSLKLVGFVPQFTKVGLRIATETGHGLGPIMSGWVGLGMGGIGGTLLILGKTMQLSKNIKDEKMHRKWIDIHRETERVIDRVNSEDIKKSEEMISALLSKRKETDELRRKQLNKIIENLKSQSFEDCLKALKNVGMRIPLEIHTKEQLLEVFKNYAERDNLIEETIRHQDTISQLTRNGLKAQSLKKQKLEHRFSKFKLGSSTVSLLLAVISTAIMTTLAVLALVGVFSFPPLGLALLGLGFSLATIAVIVTGGLYFYSQKPALTKEWLKGVNYRLALYGIPATYQAFKLQLKKIKQLRKAYAVHDLNVKINELEGILKFPNQEVSFSHLPKSLQPLVKKYQKGGLSLDEREHLKEQLKKESEKYQKKLAQNEETKQKIDAQILAAEKKLKYWKGKQAPLEKRLIQAGLRDYLKASRLDIDTKGEPIPFSQILVEGILHEPSQLDAEMEGILVHKMGIDFSKIKKIEDKEGAKEALIPLIDAYFAQGQGKIISYIKKQLKEQTHARAR